MGNGNSDFSKRITIAIINSIRDKTDLLYDILINDEAHHSVSPLAKQFLLNNIFNKRLFLTATLERSDDEHKFLTETLNIPILYNYTQRDAINDNLLNEYDLVLQSIELSIQERLKYTRYHDYILANFQNFNYDYKQVLQYMIRGNLKARELSKVFSERKKIIFNAENKVIECIKLVSQHKDDKILVFTEEIHIAHKITHMLKDICKAQMYHSGMKKTQRDTVLQDFKDDKFNVLVSCKCLDEGLNVPSANIAIIVSGNSTERQSIQRIGRVIRYEQGKKAVIYMLFAKETKEEDWIKTRIQNLKYKSITWR